MDKENVMYTYNQILFSLKKEYTLYSVLCYNMDEPQEHYGKLKKPDTKDKYCMISLLWGT